MMYVCVIANQTVLNTGQDYETKYTIYMSHGMDKQKPILTAPEPVPQNIRQVLQLM